MWKAVDELLCRVISDGAFPGCAMAAGQGTRVLYTSVNGFLTRDGEREVRHTTRYDIGALTQVLATMPLMLIALERGLVSLDDPILPFFKRRTAGQTGDHAASSAYAYLRHDPVFSVATGGRKRPRRA